MATRKSNKVIAGGLLALTIVTTGCSHGPVNAAPLTKDREECDIQAGVVAAFLSDDVERFNSEVYTQCMKARVGYAARD